MLVHIHCAGLALGVKVPQSLEDVTENDQFSDLLQTLTQSQEAVDCRARDIFATKNTNTGTYAELLKGRICNKEEKGSVANLNM